MVADPQRVEPSRSARTPARSARRAVLLAGQEISESSWTALPGWRRAPSLGAGLRTRETSRRSMHDTVVLDIDGTWSTPTTSTSSPGTGVAHDVVRPLMHAPRHRAPAARRARTSPKTWSTAAPCPRSRRAMSSTSGLIGEILAVDGRHARPPTWPRGVVDAPLARWRARASRSMSTPTSTCSTAACSRDAWTAPGRRRRQACPTCSRSPSTRSAALGRQASATRSGTAGPPKQRPAVAVLTGGFSRQTSSSAAAAPEAVRLRPKLQAALDSVVCAVRA